MLNDHYIYRNITGSWDSLLSPLGHFGYHLCHSRYNFLLPFLLTFLNREGFWLHQENWRYLLAMYLAKCLEV